MQKFHGVFLLDVAADLQRMATPTNAELDALDVAAEYLKRQKRAKAALKNLQRAQNRAARAVDDLRHTKFQRDFRALHGPVAVGPVAVAS